MRSTSDYKRAVFRNLLDLHPRLWVWFRLSADVHVPEFLRGVPYRVFEYGRDLHLPILDLICDEYGLSARLDFHGTLYATMIPWSHVFLFEPMPRRSDQKIYAWPRDAPGGDLKSIGAVPSQDAENRTGSGEHKLNLQERMTRSGLRVIK